MLDTLPDDILYLVLAHLDTARDVRALVLLNRRLRSVIHDSDEGWRVFVRARFPSLSLPSCASQYSWHRLANSLTWQTRAWEKRALSFQALLPRAPSQRSARRPRHAPFHPVLDAHHDFNSGEELVVWGAGENLVARRRTKGSATTAGPHATVWHSLAGTTLGYVAGYDDIKAISIVEDAAGHAGSLGVLVGRDNGHLALLDASDEAFASHLADLSPQHVAGDDDGEPRWSQGTINSLHVLRSHGSVAATTKSGVFLYRLPQDAGVDVAPSAFLDLASESFEAAQLSLGNAKWMGNDMMALGLSGGKDSLRYVPVTPSGFQPVQSVKNTALEAAFDINYSNNRLCAGSLTPIDASSIPGGRGCKLLLSAWRDGTVRLQDIRTPSPFDVVYCDNIDPWSECEALLPFGTSHFVGGGAHGATIKIFDFRWPRNYYHTTALPCGPDKPFPTPHQPFMTPPADPGPSRTRCVVVDGSGAPQPCRWHALSRALYYRPNGKFFLSKSLPRADAYAGVWSLARASPALSPNFYVGISGGVVEASLAASLAPTTAADDATVDPNFGYRLSSLPAARGGGGDDAVVGAGYVRLDLDASLMETGDGRLSVHNDRPVRLPPMRGKGRSRIPEKMGDGVPARLRARHRLDGKYQILTDFDSKEVWRNGTAAAAMDEFLGLI